MIIVLTLILLASIFFGIAFTVNGFRLNHHYFWLAGLCFYITSFLGAWSIGLYLLVLPILLWIFALACTINWIQKKRQYGYFAILGIAIWLVAVIYIDDYFLYYPFSWI